MSPEKSNAIFEKYHKQLPDTAQSAFKNCLNLASDDCYDDIMALSIKHKGITLALSLILGNFGADRFYLGDIATGCGKLALWICGMALQFIPGTFMAIVTTAISICLLVWRIADIFVCYRKAKNLNEEKILSALRENVGRKPGKTASPADRRLFFPVNGQASAAATNNAEPHATAGDTNTPATSDSTISAHDAVEQFKEKMYRCRNCNTLIKVTSPAKAYRCPKCQTVFYMTDIEQTN